MTRFQPTMNQTMFHKIHTANFCISIYIYLQKKIYSKILIKYYFEVGVRPIF